MWTKDVLNAWDNEIYKIYTENKKMQTNSNSVKFQGRAEINAPLALDQNYEITAKGSVVSSQDHSNQDGTKDTVFIFKLISAEIKDELGQTIKVRDPRSWSAKMRASIYREWEESKLEKSFEEYYSDRMGELLLKLINHEI